MSALAAALHKRSLPELAISNPRDNGIRQWLTSGSFQIDGSSVPEKLLLRNIILSEFVTYQLYDFQRFSLSSFETFAFCKIDPTRPRALSWPLLKMYYAGFFGGHAIMRSTGQAILRLDASQTSKLSILAQFACGQNFIVSPGTFQLRLIQNANLSLDVELSAVSESGGAHAVFWRAFKNYLEKLSIDVVADGDPDANSVIGKISDLQSVLSGKGAAAGTWLSQMRNRINYQHEFGVWFPFGAAQSEVTYIGALNLKTIPNVRFDYDQNVQSIHAFCSGSLFTARLSFDIAYLLVANSGNRKGAFARNWSRLYEECGSAL